MKIYFKYLLCSLIIFGSKSIMAQIWPFTPMIRLGNTVYYPIDSLREDKLTDASLGFDKIITKRYFDVLAANDSIGISMNGRICYFHQKSRKEPKCYKKNLFYSRRYLNCSVIKIKYLKLVNVNDSSIVARAEIKESKGSDQFKRHENFEIAKKDITGVFLGVGHNQRVFTISLASCACILGLIFITL